jgi:hypothetical protein
MKWTARGGQSATSDDGRYELRGAFASKGHFEWRGRERSTDRLICANADVDFVKSVCERHAASVAAEDRG